MSTAIIFQNTEEKIKNIYFGNKFKIFREEIGISHKQAAKILGVSHRYIKAIEKGEQELRLREVYILSKEYGQPIDIFFEDCCSLFN